MAAWVSAEREGCTIRVRVTPRSSRPGLEAGSDGVAVRVRAAPAEGKATVEAAGVLAEALGIPPSRVTLRSGTRSRAKAFRVAGMTAEEAVHRLRRR